MKFLQLRILAVVIGVSTPLPAAIVFDNLNAPFESIWFNDTPDVQAAQPFFVGDNHTITSVTLILGRNGQPDGRLHVDLYDDNGGAPGVTIGRLGTLSANSVTPVPPGGRGDHYVFDNPVSMLTPMQQYYVVLSQEGGFNWGNNDFVAWEQTGQSNGAAGAGGALAIYPPSVPEWHTVQNFPTGGPPFPVWNYARIEAIPEPSIAALSLLSFLPLVASRRRK